MRLVLAGSSNGDRIGLRRTLLILATLAVAWLTGCSSVEPTPGTETSEASASTEVVQTSGDEVSDDTSEANETETYSDGATKPLTPAYGALRYVVEGSAGTINILWTSAWGGNLSSSVDTASGTHEIEIGETTRGVLPAVTISPPTISSSLDDSSVDLSGLTISIFDGTELLQQCGTSDHYRTTIRCSTGRLQSATVIADASITIDRAATVHFSQSAGHQAFSESFQVDSATTLNYSDIAVGFLHVTATSNDGTPVEVSLSIDGELASAGETSASVTLVSDW